MSYSFNAVRQIRQSIVRPSGFSIRMIAIALAALVGLAGNFMEASPQLKELDMSSVVEQIHSTMERREEVKDLENEMKAFGYETV